MLAAVEFEADIQEVSGRSENRGPSVILRIVCFLFGISFIAAGIGLWMVPGLFLDGGIILTKAILSILLCAAGVGMTQISIERPLRELHFDRRFQQVYLVEATPRGPAQVLKVFDYENISKVDVTETDIVLVGQFDQTLTTVPIESRRVREELIEQLRSDPILV